MSLEEAAIAVAIGVFAGSTGARWLLLAEMLLHRRWHRWRNREALAEQARQVERATAMQQRIHSASARATAASVTRLDEDDDTRVAFGEIIEALLADDEEKAREIASDTMRSHASEVRAVDQSGAPMPGVPAAVALEVAIDGMISAARYVVVERQRER